MKGFQPSRYLLQSKNSIVYERESLWYVDLFYNMYLSLPNSETICYCPRTWDLPRTSLKSMCLWLLLIMISIPTLIHGSFLYFSLVYIYHVSWKGLAKKRFLEKVLYRFIISLYAQCSPDKCPIYYLKLLCYKLFSIK